MTAEQIAAAHQRRRKQLAKRAADEVARLWARVDRADIARSWFASVPAAMTVLSSAQVIAAASAGVYLDDLAAAYDVPNEPVGRVRVDGFAGVASDGRDLAALLYQPAITSLVALKQGATLPRALMAGRFTADMITRTQVADAGRTADQVAMVARPRMHGYVRVLSPPSCSRCAILAGRFYRWNAGFQRHPRCDCTHQPVVSAAAANDLLTKPRAYFDSLSRAEQDRVFTESGAEAIRLGADPAQVVNARRGAAGLAPAGARITAEEARLIRGGRHVGHLATTSVFGQQVYITTEGTTTRGLAGRRLGARTFGEHLAGNRYRTARPPRLMPESILQAAGGNRDEAIRLLRRFGYIT